MYCMCEKGLYRSPQEIHAGLMLAAFPILHGKSDEYCSARITDVIRSVLPKPVKDRFSAKSLRQAGISQCSKHPHMTIFHLSALSGHFRKTSAAILNNGHMSVVGCNIVARYALELGRSR